MAARVINLCTILALAANVLGAIIPDYVISFAPLVYMDVNDPFQPSDIGAQVLSSNTAAELNFTTINSASSLSLNNLSSVNTVANCNVNGFNQCPLYLTSKQNVSTHPTWLYGITPDSTGKTVGAKSCAVIVNDHGDNTVDAFYMYFYAYNLGENVSGTVLGNHVGDWEHTMLRFVNGQPQAMWYSAHDGGFTYTYNAVSKNNSRPIVYASLGGHANYPTPGLQSRQYGTITLNDTTSAGPLWDPVANAYFYTFALNSSSPYNATFTPVADPRDPSSGTPPVDWLYFLGRWGDKRYPDSNPIQINVLNITFAYDDGPTGPLDKKLQRNGTCPKDPCTTTSTLPVPSGVTAPVQTITRSEAPTMATGTKTSSAGTTSSTSSSNAVSISTTDWHILGLVALWSYVVSR